MLRRGDLYRVKRPGGADPKSHRVFVIVGRQASVSSNYRTAICAPIVSQPGGTAVEVAVDETHGLKHHSFIQCDGLTSVPKALLTDYIGSLDAVTLAALDRALVLAVT